jgi:hypothetical protein
MNNTEKLLAKYPELKEQIEEIIEDAKFSVKHLVPMKDCECGGGHEHIEGVMYRMCAKCRGLYAVRDEDYIKRHGELPDMGYDINHDSI